jgi:hypothetical protein
MDYFSRLGAEKIPGLLTPVREPGICFPAAQREPGQAGVTS